MISRDLQLKIVKHMSRLYDDIIEEGYDTDDITEIIDEYEEGIIEKVNQLKEPESKE